MVVCFNNIEIMNKPLKAYFLETINITKITNLFRNKKIEKVNLNMDKVLSKELVPFKDGALVKINEDFVNPLMPGSVIYVGYLEYYGNSVIIKGIDGKEYHYGFLEKIYVKLYDEVTVETVLADLSLDHDMLYYLYFLEIKGYDII